VPDARLRSIEAEAAALDARAAVAMALALT
jgi:hypothetical protein